MKRSALFYLKPLHDSHFTGTIHSVKLVLNQLSCHVYVQRITQIQHDSGWVYTIPCFHFCAVGASRQKTYGVLFSFNFNIKLAYARAMLLLWVAQGVIEKCSSALWGLEKKNVFQNPNSSCDGRSWDKLSWARPIAGWNDWWRFLNLYFFRVRFNKSLGGEKKGKPQENSLLMMSSGQRRILMAILKKKPYTQSI